MANKVIVIYFILAIVILYMKLGGIDDSMDMELFGVSFIVYIPICYVFVNYILIIAYYNIYIYI